MVTSVSLHTGAIFYSFTDYSARKIAPFLKYYIFHIQVVIVVKSNKYMHEIIVVRKPWLQSLVEDRLISWWLTCLQVN